MKAIKVNTIHSVTNISIYIISGYKYIIFQGQVVSQTLPRNKFENKRKGKERFVGYFPDHSGLKTLPHNSLGTSRLGIG